MYSTCTLQTLVVLDCRSGQALGLSHFFSFLSGRNPRGSITWGCGNNKNYITFPKPDRLTSTAHTQITCTLPHMLDKIVLFLKQRSKTQSTNHQSLRALYRRWKENRHILLMFSVLHYSNGVTKKISNSYFQGRPTFHIFPERS